MSRDLNVWNVVVPVGCKVPLDFQVQADGIQQLRLSVESVVHVRAPNGMQTMRKR